MKFKTSQTRWQITEVHTGGILSTQVGCPPHGHAELLRAHYISGGVKNLFATYWAKAFLVRTAFICYMVSMENFVRQNGRRTMTILGLVLRGRLFAVLTFWLIRLTLWSIGDMIDGRSIIYLVPILWAGAASHRWPTNEFLLSNLPRTIFHARRGCGERIWCRQSR